MSKTTHRILVVEDDPELNQLMGELLSASGYQALCAKNGAAGLEILFSGFRPHLIILDWFMPNLSGEQFLNEISLRSQFNDIPVVVMSGAKDIGRILQHRDDVRLVLEKPVGLDQLLQAIESVLTDSEV